MVAMSFPELEASLPSVASPEAQSHKFCVAISQQSRGPISQTTHYEHNGSPPLWSCGLLDLLDIINTMCKFARRVNVFPSFSLTWHIPSAKICVVHSRFFCKVSWWFKIKIN